MADTGWAVTLHDVPPGAYYSPRIYATGPALQTMLIELIVDLADAAHGKGEAADAWDTYTTARLNHEAAREFGAEDVDETELEAAEAIALTDVLDRLHARLVLMPDEALGLAVKLGQVLTPAARKALREIGRTAA